jgi:hypothetical protein
MISVAEIGLFLLWKIISFALENRKTWKEELGIRRIREQKNSEEEQYQTPIPNTNAIYQYQIPIPNTNTKYQYQIPIPNTNTKYQYQIPIPNTNTNTKKQYQIPMPNN